MPDVFIGAGTTNDPKALPLYTRKRNWISNEQRTPSAPHISIAVARTHLKGHPKWRIRSFSSTYNCMGMVFSARRTWIDPSEFALIREDDGYSKRERLADALPGDIAAYENAGGELVHVGLVICVTHVVRTASTQLLVLSQFGSAGEYLHDGDDLPHGLLIATPTPILSVWSEAMRYEL